MVPRHSRKDLRVSESTWPRAIRTVRLSGVRNRRASSPQPNLGSAPTQKMLASRHPMTYLMLQPGTAHRGLWPPAGCSCNMNAGCCPVGHPVGQQGVFLPQRPHPSPALGQQTAGSPQHTFSQRALDQAKAHSCGTLQAWLKPAPLSSLVSPPDSNGQRKLAPNGWFNPAPLCGHASILHILRHTCGSAPIRHTLGPVPNRHKPFGARLHL